MMNTMTIDGYKAIIQYDPDIEMFRGEFIGLNGGADFYAKDIDGLRKEGKTSLQIFLEMCREDGVEPKKEYSGKFNLRIPSSLHGEVAARAAATGKSINQWLIDLLNEKIHETNIKDVASCLHYNGREKTVEAMDKSIAQGTKGSF